jgi:hypothetical protein
MEGMEKFGKQYGLDEAALGQLWEAISNGKDSLTKDDFKLSDIKEAVQDFNSTNTSLMTNFSDIMDIVIKGE